MDDLDNGLTYYDKATVLAGRYRVVRQLGHGGMGSVWLAEDTVLDNRKVAVKMLPSILISDKHAYRQLKKEATRAMELSHPNIVTVRSFEDNNGNPFIVMDYVDGQSLSDYLADKGTLSVEETERILKPIASAIDFAHTKEILHRDIKPANVMIAKDGTPYVLDFSIACELNETMTRATGKQSSGTPSYMSPEQLNGDAPAAAQDVYSFAAMLYECLSGNPPFYRGQIEYQIMNKTPEALSVPGCLSDLVMKGLSKTSEGRPKNCAAYFEGQSDPLSEVLLDFIISPIEQELIQKWDSYIQLHGSEPDILCEEQLKCSLLPIKKSAALLVARTVSSGPVVVKCGPLSIRIKRDYDWRYCRNEIIAENFIRESGLNVPRSVWLRKTISPEKLLGTGEVDEDKLEGVYNLCSEYRFCAEIYDNLKDDDDATIALVKQAERDMVDSREAALRFLKCELADGERDLYRKTYWNRVVDGVLYDADRVPSEDRITEVAEYVDGGVCIEKRWKSGNAEVRRKIKQQIIVAYPVLAFLANGEVFKSDNILCDKYDKLWFIGNCTGFDCDGINSCDWEFFRLVRDDGNGVLKEILEGVDDEDLLKAARRYQFAKLARCLPNYVGNSSCFVEYAKRFDCMIRGDGAERNRYVAGDTKTITLPGGATMKMVYCPPGEFIMGSPEDEDGRWDDELQHRVKLTKGFWMGKFPVTQKQWECVMGSNPSKFQGGNDLPVEQVSWDDCQEFCSKAGRGLRLPTEAEWEYACRAGTTGAYAGMPDDMGWYRDNSGDEAHTVGSKAPNAWGLYDMHGNVFEWCSDWYGDYPNSEEVDPIGSLWGKVRVNRGGCCNLDISGCRSASRGVGEPGYRNYDLGFRVCCSEEDLWSVTLPPFELFKTTAIKVMFQTLET